MSDDPIAYQPIRSQRQSGELSKGAIGKRNEGVGFGSVRVGQTSRAARESGDRRH